MAVGAVAGGSVYRAVITPPREPIGNSQDSKWLRDLLRYTKSIALKEGVGYRRNVTADGTILSLEDGAGGGTSTPVDVQIFRVKSFEGTNEGDKLTCHTWNGVTEGTEDIAVYKPYKLRKSIWNNASAVIDGVNVAYVYLTNVKRRASVPSGAYEIQVVVPRYLINDQIIAIKIGGDWYDINADGRAWARKYQQGV